MASATFSKAMRDCSKEHYFDAAKETMVTAMASMLPLIIGFAISFVLFEGRPKAVLVAFLESNGALFVAASLAGPLFYIISKKYGKFPGTLTYKFPAGLLFLGFAAVICLIASIMFTLSVAYSGNGDGTGTEYAQHVRVDVTRWVSFILLSASLMFLFIVSAVRNMLDDGHAPTDAMHKDEEDFVKEWSQP
jgi:hypothetical protein